MTLDLKSIYVVEVCPGLPVHVTDLETAMRMNRESIQAPLTYRIVYACEDFHEALKAADEFTAWEKRITNETLI